jgi:hypothetical protein
MACESEFDHVLSRYANLSGWQTMFLLLWMKAQLHALFQCIAFWNRISKRASVENDGYSFTYAAPKRNALEQCVSLRPHPLKEKHCLPARQIGICHQNFKYQNIAVASDHGLSKFL